MFVMQGDMPYPSGGNPIAQGIRQVAAGGHLPRRHLRDQLPQALRQIGNLGETARHVYELFRYGSVFRLRGRRPDENRPAIAVIGPNHHFTAFPLHSEIARAVFQADFGSGQQVLRV